jgi:hypothetical protein
MPLLSSADLPQLATTVAVEVVVRTVLKTHGIEPYKVYMDRDIRVFSNIVRVRFKNNMVVVWYLDDEDIVERNYFGDDPMQVIAKCIMVHDLEPGHGIYP